MRGLITCGLCCAFTLAAITRPTRASFTQNLGPQLSTPAGNLVSNPSFETGSLGAGDANKQFWATGSTQGPVVVPPGWTSAGQSNTYADWGSDDGFPPYRTRGSEILVDGTNAVYFGNGTTFVSPQPTFNTVSGEVTFAGAPTWTPTFGGPVSLSQTINTQLTPSPSYTLNFWVSGEGSISGGNPAEDGILGLQVTNVLPGDPITYWTVPSGAASPVGPFRQYEFFFTPINSSLPVTVQFFNWGHVDLSPFGGTTTTELVLDHVMVNAIPEPSMAALIAIGCVGLARRPRLRGG